MNADQVQNKKIPYTPRWLAIRRKIWQFVITRDDCWFSLPGELSENKRNKQIYSNFYRNKFLYLTTQICLQLFLLAAVVLAFDRLYKQLPVLTVKNLRGRMVRGDGEFDSPPCGFSKNICSRERMKPWFFVTFNISISHIFSKNFIQIPQVVQKIWRFSPSI